MTDKLDSYIEAAAEALDLPLDPAWKPAVKANLAVTLGHAATVAGAIFHAASVRLAVDALDLLVARPRCCIRVSAPTARVAPCIAVAACSTAPRVATL